MQPGAGPASTEGTSAYESSDPSSPPNSDDIFFLMCLKVHIDTGPQSYLFSEEWERHLLETEAVFNSLLYEKERTYKLALWRRS